MGFWHRLHDFWFKGIDTRVYTTIRVWFSVTMLVCLAQLWPDRIAFFTESGMVHGDRWPEGSGVWHQLSVFTHVTTEPLVTLVFLASATSMVLLGLGVLSRLNAILVLYWQISYTVSIPAMHAGWDELLRNIALFVAIGPLGRPLFSRGGAGSRLPVSEDVSPRYTAVFLQLLLTMIYWQTVWEKVPHAGWQSGEMISYFMVSEYARFPNIVWAEPPFIVLSNILTYGTLVVEAAVPVLLFRRETRWWGFACGIGLHGGIALVSPIWLFSLAIMIPYFAFLERHDFERMAEVWGKVKARFAAPTVEAA